MNKENLNRYFYFTRQATNRSINFPTGVIAGRTLSECIITMILFFGLSYADYVFSGLFVGGAYFFFSIKIREKYPRAIIQHLMYSLGVYGDDKQKIFWKRWVSKIGLFDRDEFNPTPYFTITKKISINKP